MRCAECGAEMRESAEPLQEDYRGERLVVKGIRHFVCDECGETAFAADAIDRWSEAVDAAYRKKLDLLLPSEIRQVRKTLHLTQKEFEVVLGVGKTAVSRWETGKLVQGKTEDILIRILRDHPSVARELVAKRGVTAASAAVS